MIVNLFCLSHDSYLKTLSFILNYYFWPMGRGSRKKIVFYSGPSPPPYLLVAGPLKKDCFLRLPKDKTKT